MVYSRVFVYAAGLMLLLNAAQADTPTQVSASGTVQIRYVDPADVTVSLSGPAGYAREVQVTGGQVFADLQPGTYELQARKEGYRNFNQTLEVAAGATADTLVTLVHEESTQALAEPGTLQLTWVDPGSVTMKVSGPDGFDQETTVTGGQVFTGLAAGSYEVAVSKKGYRSATQTVEVTANQTSSLSIILDKQKGQPKTEAAEPEVANETESAADVEKTAPQLSTTELLGQGETLYVQAGCSGCHGGDGGGNQGPAFVGNDDLADADYVARTIVSGNGGMPSFGARLSDEDIASLATYIRNSWGNNFGAVSPTEVAQQR